MTMNESKKIEDIVLRPPLRESYYVNEALSKQFNQPEYRKGSDFTHVEIGDKNYFLPSYGRKGTELPFEEATPQALSYLDAIAKGILYNEPVVIFTPDGTLNDPFITESRMLLYRLTGISSTNNVLIDAHDIQDLNGFIETYGQYYTELKGKRPEEVEVSESAKPVVVIRNANVLPKSVRIWITVQLEQSRIGNKHLRSDGRSPLTLLFVPVAKKDVFVLRDIPRDQDGKHQFSYAYERSLITPEREMTKVPKSIKIISKNADTTVPMQDARQVEYMNPFFDFPKAVEELSSETKRSMLARMFGPKTSDLGNRSVLAMVEDTIVKGSMRITVESLDSAAKKAPSELTELETYKWAVKSIMAQIVEESVDHSMTKLKKPYGETKKKMMTLLDNLDTYSARQDELFELEMERLTGMRMKYSHEDIGIALREVLDDSASQDLLKYLAHRGQYEALTDAIRGKDGEHLEVHRNDLLKVDPELYYESLVGVENVDVRLRAAGSAINMAFNLYQQNSNLSQSSIKSQRPTKQNLEEAIAGELSENPRFVALIARGLQLLRDFPKDTDNVDTLTIRNKAFEFFSKLKVGDESLLDMEGAVEDTSEEVIEGFRHSFLLKMAPVLLDYVENMLEAVSIEEKQHWLSWKKFFDQEFSTFKTENFEHFDDEQIQTLEKVYEAQFTLMTLLCYSMVGDQSDQVEMFKTSLIRPHNPNVLDEKSPVPEMVGRAGVHKVIKIYAPKSLTFNVYNSFQRSLDIMLMLADTHMDTDESWVRRRRFLETHTYSDGMLEALHYSVSETEKYLRYKDMERSLSFFKFAREVKQVIAKRRA